MYIDTRTNVYGIRITRSAVDYTYFRARERTLRLLIFIASTNAISLIRPTHMRIPLSPIKIINNDS